MSDYFQLKASVDGPTLKVDNPIKITDLTFRDGQQALFNARGRTADMIPIAEMVDEIGFQAIETLGGSTFEAMHRYLNEDPWERLRTLKRYICKTPFSMVIRAQNLVGHKNYPDDIARAFIDRAAANGVDIFRTFDPLNDFRNFETVAPAVKNAGRHFQGCICYSLTGNRLGGEVYNLDYYLGKADELVKIGADSICLKDTAGLMAPYDAFELIRALKKRVSIPISLHSHFTSGMAGMTHLKAIEAGVDIIDTCLSPYAYRNSHPAIEPLVISLQGTNRDPGFDIAKLAKISEILEAEILPKYKHLLSTERVSLIDMNVHSHQAPGAIHAILTTQLKKMNALDKLDDVYAELPKVRRDLGQIPYVAPVDRIIAVQAVNNVLFDDKNERYKMITAQIKDLCYGLYGKTTLPINSDLLTKALKGYPRGEKPISVRPAEVLEPELKNAASEVKGLAMDQDDEILYALFPVSGKQFLKWKYGKEVPPDEVIPKTLEQALLNDDLIKKALAGELVEKSDKSLPPKSSNLRTFNVFMEDEYFEIEVDEVGGPPVIRQALPLPPAGVFAPPPPQPAPVSKPTPAPPKPAATPRPAKPTPSSPPAASSGTKLTAPMPGTIIRYEVKVGDTVKKGDTVVILEAMKMENSLSASVDGVISAINYSNGDSVAKNDVLCLIG